MKRPPTHARVQDRELKPREAAFVGVSGAVIGAVAVFASPSTAVLVALIPLAVSLGFMFAQRVAPNERRLTSARLLAWVGLLAPIAINYQRIVADTRAAPVSGVNVVQAFVAIVCLFLVVAICRIRWWPANGIEWLLVAFVGWAVLSSLWSTDSLASLLKAGQLLVALLLIGVLVRSMPPNQDGALRHLVSAIAVLAFAVLAGAIIAPGTAFVPTTSTGGGVQLAGVFPSIHPDILGLLLCYGVVAAVAGVWPQWCSKRSTRVFLGCVFLAELLLSRSRASLSLVLVGVVVLAFVDRTRRLKLLIVLIAFVLLSLGTAPLASGPVSSFLKRGQSAQNINTLSGRTDNWHQELAASAGSRIGGLGYYAGHRFSNEVGLSNLDSAYVETIVDLGLVGLGLLVLALLAGLQRVVRGTRSTTQALRLAMYTIGVISALVTPSLQAPGIPMAVLAFVMMMPSARSGRTDAPSPWTAEHPRRVHLPI